MSGWLLHGREEKTNTLVKYDFQYNGVESDHEGGGDCDSYGCEQEGICRCYTIERAWVSDLDFHSVVEKITEIFSKYGGKQKERNDKINSLLDNEGSDYMNDYFIHRVLSYYKLWDKKSWDVDFGGNYYGDEVFGINIEESIAKKIDIALSSMDSLITIEEKTLYLLELEYGDYDTDLIGKKFSFEIVKTDEISLNQTKHAELVKEKNLDHYMDYKYNLIRGIVLKSGKNYKALDGYHRLIATDSEYVEVIVIE